MGLLVRAALGTVVGRLLFGCGFLVWGVWGLVAAAQRDAEVVGVVTAVDGDDCFVEYAVREPLTHGLIVDSGGRRSPCASEVGDLRWVHYDPDDPDDASLDSAGRAAWLYGFTSVLGLGLLVLAAGTTLFSAEQVAAADAFEAGRARTRAAPPP